MKLRALGLVLISTVFLAACPQAPTSAEKEKIEPPPPAAMILLGTVSASISRGPIVEMVAHECTINADGTGAVSAGDDGAFTLTWANNVFQLVWNSEHGSYSGAVNATITEKVIAFEGTADGQQVSGTATCN